jgi:hypothetical protein
MPIKIIVKGKPSRKKKPKVTFKKKKVNERNPPRIPTKLRRKYRRKRLVKKKSNKA